MINPFTVIGIVVIVTGIFCLIMAAGALGHDLPAQIMCLMAGIVAIGMGVCLINLMKDDTLYQKETSTQSQDGNQEKKE